MRTRRNRRPRLEIAAFCLLFLAAGVPQARADEAKKLEVGKWYPSLESGLTLSQGTYSDNWAGGDKGSIIWTFITNANLESQLNPTLDWNNTLKLAYGQTSKQSVSSTGVRSWDSPEKSTDLINLDTILRFTLGGFVDPFASGHFDSQFQDASDPTGRTLSLNPLRFQEAAGIARQFVSTEDQTLLSRVGFTFGENVRRLFRNPPPDHSTASESTTDGGIQWVTDSKSTVLNKRVAWTSKLTVYKPLFYSGKKVLDGLTPDQKTAAGLDADVAGFTTAPNADWENIFTSQITKVISVNFYVRWIYDKYDLTVKPIADPAGGLANPADVRAAIRKAGQFKETMTLGLTYRFL